MSQRTDFLRPVTVELDRERRLHFGYLALEALESESGVPLGELMSEGNPLLRSARGARILLWACLLDEDPELRPAEAGRLIDKAPGPSLAAKLDYVSRKVGECIQRSLDPDAEAAAAAAKKKADAGSNGESSSSSPRLAALASASSTA